MQARSFPGRQLILFTFLLSFGFLVHADMVGYSDVYDCLAESSQLSARHHHDWSQATQEARWRMISSKQSPFGLENDYSFLVVTDKLTKKILFRSPVPALRSLWISPDSRFIVGISNVKLWNPVQLVVFSREGRRLFSQAVDSSTFAGVSGSVTNWVHWYKEPTPQIAIAQTEGWVLLRIEGRHGETRLFKFQHAG